jgi:hypothetical protein
MTLQVPHFTSITSLKKKKKKKRNFNSSTNSCQNLHASGSGSRHWNWIDGRNYIKEKLKRDKCFSVGSV